MTVPLDRAALYGEDYAEPDTYAVVALASGTVAAAISVGGQKVAQRKADAPVPNEDAVLVVEQGARVLLAVADGHYGHAASHDLIERLDDRVTEAPEGGEAAGPPGSLEELVALVVSCAVRVGAAARAADAADDGMTSGGAGDASESTLTVAVLDRAAGEVFGVSLGDSPAVALGLERGTTWLTETSRRYARPWEADTLQPERMRPFGGPVRPGELVVVFTDGVNECRYGRPEESIGDRHLEALTIREGRRAEGFAEALVKKALEGVDGHGGGEDNVGIAVVRV